MYKLKKLAIVLIGILVTMAISTVASAQDFTYTPSDAGWFLGLGLTVCIAWVIVWLVIWILVGIWVYKDAEKRGKSGALWLIIVILLGFIGIIIWLIVRPPIGGEKTAESGRRCPNCGRPIPMDARVCPYCGKKFEE